MKKNQQKLKFKKKIHRKVSVYTWAKMIAYACSAHQKPYKYMYFITLSQVINV